MTITNPTYYKNDNGEDLITYFVKNFTREQFVGFMVGNIMKYITRFEGKNGLEDLDKAKEYITRLHDELSTIDSGININVPTEDWETMTIDDFINRYFNGEDVKEERNTRPEENRKNLEDIVDSINEANVQADKEIEEEEQSSELRDWLHDINQSLREATSNDFVYSLLKTTRKGKH